MGVGKLFNLTLCIDKLHEVNLLILHWFNDKPTNEVQIRSAKLFLWFNCLTQLNVILAL